MHHGMLEWVNAHGYLGLAALLAVGVILPLPEDTTLLFAGYLVSIGKFAAVPTWLAADVGCMTGITISYTIGRTCGLMIVHRFGRHLGITPERLQHTTDWFHREGRWGLLFGYFVPGVRHLTALIAGSSKVRFPFFMAFTGLGAVTWCSLFLSLGYILGNEWKRFGASFNQHRLEVSAGVVLVLAAAFYWEWSRKRQNSKS
jgi:membrane protein DedA with SNARE-associated domain